MGKSHRSATFVYQADALLRKNLIIQKRRMKANIMLLAFPFLIFSLLGFIQITTDRVTKKQSSTKVPAIRSPPEMPPLLQIPAHEYRAVRNDFLPFMDLPHGSCKKMGSCPVSVLITGNNQSLGESLGENMFTSSSTPDASDFVSILANDVLGSDSNEVLRSYAPGNYYQIQSQCTPNFTRSNSTMLLSMVLHQDVEVECVEGLHLWRNSSSEINNELFKGYLAGNSRGKINEIMTAYDFSNSSSKGFNTTVWYNSTYNSPEMPWIPRLVNLASNAYLQFLIGPSAKILFKFVKDMPSHEQAVVGIMDVTSSLSTILYTWVILLLLPVILTTLVYEKQQNLRLMMKMHGLGDGPYWLISYAYFLLLSAVYMLIFVVAGSCLGLRFFTLNDYGIQFAFYFIFINLQISLAFLLAAIFSTVKTAAVISYLMVFASGLLGSYCFKSFIQDASIPRKWILMMELYPGLSLYRGLYEFSQVTALDVLNPENFSQAGEGSDGMGWEDLSDRTNGMGEILIIMLVEWFIFLFVAYYLDQVVRSGSGVKRSPLFFLQNFGKKLLSPSGESNFQRDGPNVFIQMEKEDVAREREKVEQLLLESSKSHSIVCDNIRKVYPGRDGNPEKLAVKGLSLALPRGECFGMLGPNGAGKTSFIKMMIGLMEPTSGTAYVEGLDLRTQMDQIYNSMGVCPQHDLLWETLTGREHLVFYGRLKNLKGDTLTQAVEESLKNVNLFHGGVADKASGKYSGGMKRRLSVAISLIGDPKVVYMDEPSTGLDPASRNNLWNVVKQAKQDRAIILTTHSMEEAEHLCDRLGVFVDGSLQCIGNPKELKARYGGTYIFTITTSQAHEEQVESMVRSLSPSANKTYHISGTQKFELPKHEVRISDVFEEVENAKSRFEVQAWGLADTTLEEVFVKVASDAQSFNAFS